MATGNTTLLGLALPVEGELDGTWGDVVNDSITSLVDSAVAGTTTLSADADVTLTDTALAANQARQAVLLWTASNGASTRNITAPARSKAYLVINSGTGAIVIRGAGPTTGVTVPSGTNALVAWNGSDFVKVASNPVVLTSDVSGTLPIANGGTGTTSTTFANLTTNVTGTLPIANGGTGATTAAAARTGLGATTLGANIFIVANPSAVTFPRFNANNTVSSLSAADFRTAIGAGTGGGSVTSVGGTGTVNGITLSGTVTSSGNLTLGGALSDVSLTSQVTGTLPVANGGTGATSLTANNVILGNGTSAVQVVAPGTAGNVLTSNGTTWTSAVAAGGSEIIRVARTSNTALAAANNGNLIDITSGTFTQTFVAAATLGNGWFAYIQNSGTGDITLDPDDSETIDGLTSYIMYPGEVRLVQCDGTALRSVVLNAFYRTFTASGTFTKPPGYSAYQVALWGGGGGGGKAFFPFQSGGGGGGACNLVLVQPSTLSTSTSFTIGAGGTGATASASAGGNGGTSAFGTLFSAFGGGGGGLGGTDDQNGRGGGGGGVFGTGGQGGASFGVGGSPHTVISGNSFTDDPGFGGANGGFTAGQSVFGGAGGGGSQGGASASSGGLSVYGGGGGGGGGGNVISSGGISTFGGAGGGGSDDTSASAGTAPAGGGGGTRSGASAGAGARGELRIWGVI